MDNEYPAFLVPACCGRRISGLLAALADCGDAYVTLMTLCESCQQGYDIALDFVNPSGADKHFLADLMRFGEHVGFRPTILLTEEEREHYFRRFHRDALRQAIATTAGA